MSYLLLSISFAAEPPTLRSGDLVFQESTSEQARFLERATHSRYSHVGMVLVIDGEPWVYEAVQPVRRTPLEVWIDRGVDDHVVIMRPLERIEPDQVQDLRAYAEAQLGKDYDPLFDWSDEALYCSEYVVKAYARAGVELAPLRRFDDYDLSDPGVQRAIQGRWGTAFDPSAMVIAPSDLLVLGERLM